MAKAPAVKWTREHFLIALNLYCKLPFGKLHKGNPIIVETAAKMGRTPSSLAMKLVNFASLDPVQQARGIRGLQGATKQDKTMWAEFHSNLSALGAESDRCCTICSLTTKRRKWISLRAIKSDSSRRLAQLKRRRPSKFAEDSNFSGNPF